MLRTLKSPRRLAAVAVFAIVAMSGFGFAAQNGFTGENRAGNGNTTIGAFTISNIHYSLDANDGDLLDEVSFDLSAPASEVMTSLDGGSTWVNCGASTLPNNSVVCTLSPGVDVFGAQALEVSAVS